MQVASFSSWMVRVSDFCRMHSANAGFHRRISTPAHPGWFSTGFGSPWWLASQPLIPWNFSNHYTEPSFQILHAMQSLERILGDFLSRSAVYEIVFWNGSWSWHHSGWILLELILTDNRHLTVQTGMSKFVVASRSLARRLLFQHLLTLDVKVHTFLNLSDPEWLQYENLMKVRT